MIAKAARRWKRAGADREPSDPPSFPSRFRGSTRNRRYTERQTLAGNLRDEFLYKMYAARPYEPPDMNRYAVMDLTRVEWVTFGATTVPTGPRDWAHREAQTLNAAGQVAGWVPPATVALTVPTLEMGHITGLAWSASANRLLGGHHRPSLPGTLAVGGTIFDVVVIAAASGPMATPYNVNIELRVPGTTRAAIIGGSIAQKSSDLFPDTWNAAQIGAAIEDAYREAARDDQIRGFVFTGTGNGVEIKGFLARSGPRAIITAYPKL
jgi:hypothetical protein